VSSSPRVYTIRGFLNLGIGPARLYPLAPLQTQSCHLCLYTLYNHLHTSSHHLPSSVLYKHAHTKVATVYSVSLWQMYSLLYMGWTVRGLNLSRRKRLLFSPKRLRLLWGLSTLLFLCRKGREVVQPLPPSSVEVKEWLDLYLRSSYMPSRRAQAWLHPLLASYFTVCCNVKHTACSVNL
jgi:hypothetical protein